MYNIVYSIIYYNGYIKMKKQKTLMLDEEVIEYFSNDNSLSNNINNALKEVMNNNSAKDTFTQLLCIAKKLNDDRKNGLIEFKG